MNKLELKTGSAMIVISADSKKKVFKISVKAKLFGLFSVSVGPVEVQVDEIFELLK